MKQKILTIIFFLYVCVGFSTINVPSSNKENEKKILDSELLFKNKSFTIYDSFPDIYSIKWLNENEIYFNFLSPINNTYSKKIFNLKTQTFSLLSKSIPPDEIKVKNNILLLPSQKIITLPDSFKNELNNVTLSPDKQKISFTTHNNLFLYDLSTGSLDQISHSKDDHLLNGYASWVYYEEILGRSSNYKAYWWSPSSKYIGFMQFDESSMPKYILTHYEDSLRFNSTQYPQAGENNPKVKIGIYQIETQKILWINFAEYSEDGYFGEPQWNTYNDRCWISWQNRKQNYIKTYEINPVDGQIKMVYEERQETWVELETKNLKKFYFLANPDQVILSSDQSGWEAIYLYSPMTFEKKIITGEYTVTDIIHINEKDKSIFFTAKKGNSTRENFYKIDFNGQNLKALSDENYHHSKIVLSPNQEYFVDIFENHLNPPNIGIYDIKGKEIKKIASKAGENFNNYTLCQSEIILIPSKDKLFNLPCYITYPLDFDPLKKYPLLISIYGGPNAGTVKDNWNWNKLTQQYANEGLIQVSLDHRASGHFGKKGQNYIYKNLGYWEIEDYSTMVEYLIENKNVDPTRVCITGFSYGGYMTCLALTKASHIFTHGMAGGAVTDWKWYDTDYTERFMQTPKDNPEGYKNSSVLTYTSNFKGRLQLVHGVDDDNVHIQNSIEFLNLLQENLKQNVEFMIYPGGKHGWRGNKWIHFRNLKINFIYNHLLNKKAPDYLFN